MTDPWKLTTALAMASASLMALATGCRTVASMPAGDAADALRVAATLAAAGGLLSLAVCLVCVFVLSNEKR